MSKISPGFSLTSYTNVLTTGDCCGAINKFVVVGAENTRYSIRWSAIGNATDWPEPNTSEARAKQAGREALRPEFGNVTAIGNGDFFGYVFQERAITKITYVGGDIVFSFDTFEEGRGCQRAGRMTQVDDLLFFESDRGFHVLQNDQISDIGFGIVDDSQ